MEQLLSQWNITFELIKKNKFITIQNQISLIDYLRNNTNLLKKIEFTTQYPKKEQLELILETCYLHLFNERDQNDRNFSIGNLIRLTKFYIYQSPSIKELIQNQNGKK